jgi:formylmethanofuran dehydrogenase subunit C
MIMEQIVRCKARRGDARMSARRRFGRYRTETEKTSRRPDVEESAELRGIMKAWERYTASERWDLNRDYEKVCAAIEGLDYSARDVEGFCALLEGLARDDMFRNRAGFFLSGLMNMGKDGRYELTIPEGMEIDYIGMRNIKDVTVYGDVGGHAGLDNSGGILRILGDAGMSLGHGSGGGSIVLEGDAGEHAGTGMWRGRLEIHGNAGRCAGSHMMGGLIDIHGDAGDELGVGMGGGRILVQGNAGSSVGAFKPDERNHGGYPSKWDLASDDEHRAGCVSMKGGIIEIRGELGGISPKIRGGKVYHKGQLVLWKEYHGFRWRGGF